MQALRHRHGPRHHPDGVLGRGASSVPPVVPVDARGIFVARSCWPSPRVEDDQASTSGAKMRWSVGSGDEDRLLRRRTRTRAVAAEIVVEGQAINVQHLLDTLQLFEGADGNIKESMHADAVAAAQELKKTVSFAVNSKAAGLRTLQTTIGASPAMRSLIHLTRAGEPVGYEALQILCYRNALICQQIVTDGIVDRIAIDMSTAQPEVQCAMCHLLSALVAFNEGAHNNISSVGLIPMLVSLCRQRCFVRRQEEDNRNAAETMSLLEYRATAVLRNLSHNTLQHSNLIQAGAVDALADIMRRSTDPKTRINAALSVAILMGHEENNPRLMLDEQLVQALLDVLRAATSGQLYLGSFWTVWKLCQGLANLAINDSNKELITAQGGIEVMTSVLMGKHHKNELAYRYALSIIWNLAFNEGSRRLIMETPGLVDKIRTIMSSTESPKTKEVAKGALWTLGLEQDIKTLTEQAGVSPETPQNSVVSGHIMLSYEWGQQSSVLLIKNELVQAGYQTWMDVDKMSGSTLEAMAKAVEGSDVVLVCISKKYKESQACRTEAEYAFQQRKRIVPILMEKGYQATGWLGALIGARPYFDMTEAKRIPSKCTALFKELGTAGKTGAVAASTSLPPDPSQAEDSPENWSVAEVEEWLHKVKCGTYAAAFKERDIDGMALSGLLRLSSDRRHVHEVLTEEFGIKVIGHRLRLIEEMHRLFV